MSFFNTNSCIPYVTDQKQLQKFNPLISESNFVPRQRILLAEITSDNVSVLIIIKQL